MYSVSLRKWNKYLLQSGDVILPREIIKFERLLSSIIKCMLFTLKHIVHLKYR